MKVKTKFMNFLKVKNLALCSHCAPIGVHCAPIRPYPMAATPFEDKANENVFIESAVAIEIHPKHELETEMEM